ncbi:hypothetical protein ACHAXH_000200 [Discostella pseudostelligera]
MADRSIADRLIAILPPCRSSSSSFQPSSESAPPTINDDEVTELKSDNVVQSLERWNDDLENQLLAGTVQKPSFTATDENSESNCSQSPTVLRHAANNLHASILAQIDPSFSVDCDCDDDAEADKATWAVVNSLSDGSRSAYAESLDLRLLANLLRAAGLFLRWHAQVVQPSSHSLASPMGGNSSQLSMVVSPMTRLKMGSMIMLYGSLLDMEIVATLPDVPRFASICLFRATYGNDDVTTSARRQFANSQQGISYLMKALVTGEQPASRLFSIVRNIHHLIASCPESIPKMEHELHILTISMVEDENIEGKHGLIEVLVATLAWACRSEPPFPGGPSDRRSDLVLEILRALYALDPSNPSKSLRPTQSTMEFIGVILCELLHFPNSDERVYAIKLAVVALLLDAPNEFNDHLASTNCVKRLVEILSYQASVVVIERTNSSAEDAAAVVPILLALQRLVQSNESAHKVVKEAVFPPEDESEFEQKAMAEIAKGKTEGKVNAMNMAPLDAPRGTLRWKLIQLMTWTETTVKRSACELLWELCDGDSTQFVLRTGFGNAIHFLGIKKCVNLPENV